MQKMIDGLNRTGLFMEEAVKTDLETSRWITAVKDERPFSYMSVSGSEVSGTADFYAFMSTCDTQIIFGIECKKVNDTKSYFFTKYGYDSHRVLIDRVDYAFRAKFSNDTKPRRTYQKVSAFFVERLTSKSFELKENGGVYLNNNEKVYLACRQAVRATIGAYMNDDEPGLTMFGFPSQQSQNRDVIYVPLVITNAKLLIGEIDPSKIDIAHGTMNEEGMKFKEVDWVIQAYNTVPEDRCTMLGEDNKRITPIRTPVTIVNIESLQSFLSQADSIWTTS